MTKTGTKKTEPAWIRNRRQTAAKLWRSLPEPSFGRGATALFPAPAWPDFGRISPSAKPPVVSGVGAVMAGWPEAFQDQQTASALKRLYARLAPLSDRLTAWQESQTTGGLVIRVPAGQRLSRPIRLDYAATGNRLDTVTVIAEAGSAVTIIERLAAGPVANQPAWRGAIVRILVEADAAVNFVAIQNAPGDATIFSRKYGWCDAGATLTWTDCCLGGGLVSASTETWLQGEQARVADRQVFFGSGKQKFDLNQTVRHAASQTSSELTARGALAGQARTLSRGLVAVGRKLSDCEGRQKTATLLLSPTAVVAASPALEIGSDDVKCSHGAAVGRLNREQLFYLMSRGLNQATARKHLVAGFFAPLLAAMRESGLEEAAACLIADKLDRLAPAVE